jgi:hypothetical protein
MSDVVTKRRPMIDLDEFEKRLCQPFSSDQKDGDPLAELLRIIGDKVEPKFDPVADLLVKAPVDAGETCMQQQMDGQVRRNVSDFPAIEAGLSGAKQPQAVTPRDTERSTAAYKRPSISGDFAAIEAGLLSGLREQATGPAVDTVESNAVPSVGHGGTQYWLDQERQPVSRLVGNDGEQVRSRRPLYAMGALIIAGITGITVSSGLGTRMSGPAEIAVLKAESGSAARQQDAAINADVQAKDIASLSKPQELSPLPPSDGNDRSVGVTQAEEKSPLESNQAHIELPPVPPAPASVMAEPVVSAASVEPDAAKTDSTAPEAARLPNETAGSQAVMNEAPPVAPPPPAAAAKPVVAKAVKHAIKPPKTAAAKHSGSQGPSHQLANTAKATNAGQLPADPAPVAETKVATAPAAQPSPASGPFGFVQSAVNSITSTTAKLMQLGTH